MAVLTLLLCCTFASYVVKANSYITYARWVSSLQLKGLLEVYLRIKKRCTATANGEKSPRSATLIMNQKDRLRCHGNIRVKELV